MTRPDGPPPDPRVYFAAERTLLAWLRTGIAIMTFGFVVARFGLFLRLMHMQAASAMPEPGVSPYLGAGLVLLGVLATGLGTIEYRRYCRQLPAADLPTPHATVLPLLIACSLVAAGLILVVALLR
jgi:inner membrane protein YidH